MEHIAPLDISLSKQIQKKIDNKTKPLGALGQLEELAKQLILIQLQRRKKQTSEVDINAAISILKPSMLVFAADHGINQEQVSIAPSEVTRQMVLNFLQGGAAINCFCRSNDIALMVIDAGILEAVRSEELANSNSNVVLVEQRLGAATNDFSKQAAMSFSQVEQGLSFGQQIAQRAISQGSELLMLGEMGIANTSSAAALMVSLTQHSAEQCVGLGTGISHSQYVKKLALVKSALARIESKESQKFNQVNIKYILSELGGFEIVQMVGAILEAARQSIAIVIDGFIVSVAALIAIRFNESVADYLIFSHVSEEKAHQLLLKELQINSESGALLNLGLRLGEGTGAALSLPIIKAAASFYNDMASFESAGVNA